MKICLFLILSMLAVVALTLTIPNTIAQNECELTEGTGYDVDCLKHNAGQPNEHCHLTGYFCIDRNRSCEFVAFRYRSYPYTGEWTEAVLTSTTGCEYPCHKWIVYTDELSCDTYQWETRCYYYENGDLKFDRVQHGYESCN